MLDKYKTEMKENILYYIITSSLKGISQVILSDNTLSGLIILIAISIADYRLGIIALASSIIGNLVAHVTGASKNAVQQGLLSYNSVLMGLTMSMFLTGNIRWGIALVGAAFAAILTAAMMYFLKNLQIPVLTFPYIVLTWFFLLASYHLEIFKLSSDLLPLYLPDWELLIEGDINLWPGIIAGVGQVYFQTKLLPGILILIAAFWDNWKTGIYVIVGTVVGFTAAYCMDAEPNMLNQGLYGYNAVLTILAISKIFDADRPFAPITGFIASILSVPLTASIATWLMPYGLPGLTMSFVLVTWIFLGARKVLPRL